MPLALVRLYYYILAAIKDETASIKKGHAAIDLDLNFSEVFFVQNIEKLKKLER